MVIEKTTKRQIGHEAVLAMRAVAEAVDLARQFERDVAAGALSKGDASPVTVADFSVQALIAARLSGDFPSDALVAEEDASALRGAPDLAAHIVDLVRFAEPASHIEKIFSLIDRGLGSPSRRFWTLDPIDGTKGLLRGDQYAIALALIGDGVVNLGVLGCPRLSLGDRSVVNAAHDLRGDGGIAVAVRDRGAWWSGDSTGPLARLSVSHVNEREHARVLHSSKHPITMPKCVGRS